MTLRGNNIPLFRTNISQRVEDTDRRHTPPPWRLNATILIGTLTEPPGCLDSELSHAKIRLSINGTDRSYCVDESSGFTYCFLQVRPRVCARVRVRVRVRVVYGSVLPEASSGVQTNSPKINK